MATPVRLLARRLFLTIIRKIFCELAFEIDEKGLYLGALFKFPDVLERHSFLLQHSAKLMQNAR